jgi:predicted small lipoprotein YifL
MLKKIFTCLCLAVFVSSLAACGGGGGQGFKAGKVDENTKPLSSENAQEAAATQAF